MHYDRLTKNRIYIFSAHSMMQKSVDLSYQFHQEPHFYWLTRITEPGWSVVVNTFTMEKTLLSPETNAIREIFEGSLSDDAALECAQADKVVPYTKRDEFFKDLSSTYKEVFTLDAHPHQVHFDNTPNPSSAELHQSLQSYFKQVHDCRKELSMLRAIKTPEEVASLQQAIDVTVDAFERVKDGLVAAHYEYQIEAEFSYAFRHAGAHGHAYDPIVASGSNACTLHYGQNNARLPKNGLVLIDTGASVGGYAADITRTLKLGTPSKREVEVHGAVEKAHKEVIALIKPGLAISEYQESVDSIMTRALNLIGLLDDVTDTDTYRKYFPHAISHGLGLDVHDSLGGFKEFMPGMVLTVEPGIYIPEEGIGVRIEDDILVTETGNRNLSEKLSIAL